MALFNVFLVENHYNIDISLGDWKRVVCHGNGKVYSRKCVECVANTQPSFDSFQCKLTEIMSFIYVPDVIFCCVYDVIRRFSSFVEFYVINLKLQGVKI